MKVIDRELSWLEFNKRVLMTSLRNSIPLEERLNFLGISEENLKEFISVKFSSIISFYGNKYYNETDEMGFDYVSKYNSTLDGLKQFKEFQYKAYEELIKQLKNVDISILDYNELNEKEIQKCSKYFDEIKSEFKIQNHEIGFKVQNISDDELNFLIVTDREKNTLCLLSVPKKIPRVFQLNDNRYILIEEIISNHLNEITQVIDYVEYQTYRFIEKFSISQNENIPNRIKRYLKDRNDKDKKLFLVVKSYNKELVKLTRHTFNVSKHHVIKTENPLHLEFLTKKFINNPNLEFEPFKPSYFNYNIFDYIRKQDVILHHPYDSYQTIVDMLEKAANDENVKEIYITLYRVSSYNSPIINNLCKAALNGKSVSIILELKVRFNEQMNVDLIDKLKTSGCKVYFGFSTMKVHSKLLLIKFNNFTISHIATGNYNEITAKIYTDISYITSNSILYNDLHDLFNIIAGEKSRGYHSLIYTSPGGIRQKIVDMIKKEMMLVEKKRASIVRIKVNALSDYNMIKLIYKAAKKGVQFQIICRGMCSLVPKKNITIKSIVGRFLEHSRIYWFSNGGKPKVFISSADLLTRNLDRRVELLVPMKDEKSKEIVKNIFTTSWEDEFNSFIMTGNNKYTKLDGNNNCHQNFEKG